MGITDKVSYFIARTAAKDIPQDAGGLALIQPGLVTDGIGLALIASAWLSQKVMPPIPVIGTRAASPSTSEGEKLNTIRK